MKHTRDNTDEWTLRSLERQRARLECRECEVICERVVSPWHCLRSQCRFVYVYEENGNKYFGCLQKVFLPELDLAAFAKGVARGYDPYGYLRVARPPLPRCRVAVEQAYEALYSPSSCCNPTFFHHPAGPDEDKIRLIVRTTPACAEGEFPSAKADDPES